MPPNHRMPLENMGIVTQGITTVLAADFVSGLVHWAEDAYARKDTPLLGRLIGEANIEHHQKPRAFVARGWWESSWDLLLLSAVLVAVAWWCDHLSWHVWLFVFITANANQIHKWAHRAPHENGALIATLHKWKVLQTQKHHALHHRGDKNTRYCAVTNVLNPVLDEFEVWKTLERILERTIGLKRKIDPTVKCS